MAGFWFLRGAGQRPGDIAIAAIVAITAARYAVAYRRLRRTAGAGA
jgi:hypothetical protein